MPDYEGPIPKGPIGPVLHTEASLRWYEEKTVMEYKSDLVAACTCFQDYPPPGNDDFRRGIDVAIRALKSVIQLTPIHHERHIRDTLVLLYNEGIEYAKRNMNPPEKFSGQDPDPIPS